MEANELRIGNYVKTNTGTVTIIRGGGINAMEMKVPGSDFEPILLTEEWFVKFGFDHSFIKGTYYKEPLKLVKTPGNICFEWPDNLDYHTYFRKNIVFVHELQNLYFALTGEELIKK